MASQQLTGSGVVEQWCTAGSGPAWRQRRLVYKTCRVSTTRAAAAAVVSDRAGAPVCLAVVLLDTAAAGIILVG